VEITILTGEKTVAFMQGTRHLTTKSGNEYPFQSRGESGQGSKVSERPRANNKGHLRMEGCKCKGGVVVGGWGGWGKKGVFGDRRRGTISLPQYY